MELGSKILSQIVQLIAYIAAYPFVNKKVWQPLRVMRKKR
jgi:hypothetical protein